MNFDENYSSGQQKSPRRNGYLKYEIVQGEDNPFEIELKNVRLEIFVRFRIRMI